MISQQKAIHDANEAVASIAYACSECIAIYPITPSSPMAEHCDQWAAEGKPNLWGTVPEVIEMESEGGVAGAVHGALQNGMITTTFTASQGLLLMVPNLYKIAGEALPFCMHVAARALSTHSLSIYGDHSDVMATRQTGMALLASHSVQSAHDLAAIAHATTLQAHVPFLHFFDGFRTSHEINTYVPIPDQSLKALLDESALLAFRQRAMNPNHPHLHSTVQGPDTYFQCSERMNPSYDAIPALIEAKMQQFATLTGRTYHVCEYMGDPDAAYVFVAMGSGAETIQRTVAHLNQRGEKVGLIHIHLYRPFPTQAFIQQLPHTAQTLIVLDRTKEPGSVAEPLCLDVQSTLQIAFANGQCSHLPHTIGGRYGVGMKEFTPSMVASILDAAKHKKLPPSFSVGIEDDVTHRSVPMTQTINLETADEFRAIFYGLGSDGTVGANKNTIKIIGQATDRYAQAYFVYDSKKAGSMTISHLRFGSQPIQAPYLIQRAHLVACHQFQFVDTDNVLETLQDEGIFLLNAPFPPHDVWAQLPAHMQQTLIEKRIQLYAIDAYTIAQETGMGNRINTIMQTCFFAIAGILPKEQAIQAIKQSIAKTYRKKGDAVVANNCAAVDATLAHLHRIEPQTVSKNKRPTPAFHLTGASEFVQTVTRQLLARKGDALPVSAFPSNAQWPTGTACFEKRNLAQWIPSWNPTVCGQCNLCSLVCPHAAIRAKHFDATLLKNAPDGFLSAPYRSNSVKNHAFTLQVSPEDCTGCHVCAESCPLKGKPDEARAITMVRKSDILEQTKAHFQFFETLPWPTETAAANIQQTQLKKPLFEYSGACAGCGETPYIKLLTQLFGDHLIMANATGCSSVYTSHLPTTPYTQTAQGRGPAWASSLFEDNAEFGFGMRIAVDKKVHDARALLAELSANGLEAFSALLQPPADPAQRETHYELVAALKQKLAIMDSGKARWLHAIADFLVDPTIWAIGGDGWAYDIGFGGLDHVLASGRNMNILVLDTEVYSNTGGQQSKATPMGAVAKFAAAGKGHAKKDLGLLAMMYRHVYVAQIALGANPMQSIKALQEADHHNGPALVIAYCPCMEHGYDLRYGLEQQRLAVDTGAWPLYRYNPQLDHPMQLDAVHVKRPLSDYLARENRFQILAKVHPERAAHLLQQAQTAVHQRIAFYQKLADHN